jgi:spermidine/putrescine transport system substrate-binding protein
MGGGMGQLTNSKLTQTRMSGYTIKRILSVGFILSGFVLSACSVLSSSEPPATPKLADEIIYYSWTDDETSVIFDGFEHEYGVKVIFETYEGQEQAIENLKAGQVYDVVIMENQFIPHLVDAGLLAPLDFSNLLNFKNISPNFYDLAHDPGNQHTVPFSWGTTGIVVRTDLIEEPVTRWSDLWDARYAGHIVLWKSTPRFTIGMALNLLGYSVNSEDPAELEAALAKLLELKPHAIWLNEEETSAPWLVSGEAVMALGWAYDVWLAQEENDNIDYVLPEEGTILWGDNFVIPANSPNQYTAEVFLNYVLRPEIAAEIINATYYPMPNEPASPYIDPELLNDPVVFPPQEALQNAEIIMPLSPEGQTLYDDIWNRLWDAQPVGEE